MNKYEAEKLFWSQEINQYVRWYNGRMKELYGVPTPNHKVIRHEDIRRNALDTWINADCWRYCKHLFVEPTYFAGKEVMEIGPGPLGLGQWFIGAKLTGVDPLYEDYREMGYPVDQQNMQYIGVRVEELETWMRPGKLFDAIYSVNAIDHVDDFKEAIQQAEARIKPDGEIRIEVHYHEATTTEPCVLNDELVLSSFSKLKMKKLKESPSTSFYPSGTHPHSDRFALWSNRSYTYNAIENLK